MEMTIKSALYGLAVVVLMGTMAVTALADDHGVNMSDPLEYSTSADPSWPPAQTDESQIREPMETGAVPELPGSSSDMDCCSDSGDPTFRPGGP
ncbi:MAG: hypothetical protein CO109_06355 [Deltaproteobacteria bacterium CG_4_9_14_3_um_filter_65_9]|nr:MAG: hypothetical protein CO109_06355 [Deltaproteobacteria bacterium CG_4_9_14_3_um_filter_65_9]